MRKSLKKAVAVICAVMMLVTMVQLPVEAASTRKCYLIENRNATAYSNTGLTNKIGTIWGSDEIQVITVTSRYTYVSYPAGSRRKYAYIPTSKILTGTGGYVYTAQAQIQTYKRPGGSSYGSIYKGDKVTILGTYGIYTQVKYPVSTGYKYAFVTTANADRYIKGNSSNSASIANGTYKITTSLNGNFSLDVNGAAISNGANVEIYPYHGGANQIWKISSLGNGYYRIQDTSSGKSLDVNGGSAASGTNVQIWENNNTNAQRWRFVSAGNGYYYIINANGCYLDVKDATVRNGNNVWVFSGNGTGAQKWKLTSVTNSSSSNTNTSASWQYPMSSAYVCGNKWRSYYSARPSRPYHVGLDLASRTGNTAIYAAADGTVAKCGYNSSNGNYVVLRHTLNGKTVYSFYAHLSSRSVSSGYVSRGTKIGVMGNTGSGSSGAHLHFAIMDTLWSGSYYGYVPYFSGNKVSYGGVTYYNPAYVIQYNRLP